MEVAKTTVQLLEELQLSINGKDEIIASLAADNQLLPTKLNDMKKLHSSKQQSTFLCNMIYRKINQDAPLPLLLGIPLND
jgi:hypothetical protein